MLIDKTRNRIVCLSQDPKTIFSYGLQVLELIKQLTNLQFHVISQQYVYGRPYEDKDYPYVTWASEGNEARTTTTLKSVINYTLPTCVFSMGDIHHNPGVGLGKPLQVPWVSWFPWDNHDVPAMLRAQNLITQPDIKITMNQFSFDLMNQYNMQIDDYIYNIVNTNTFRPLSKKEWDKENMFRLNPNIQGKKILLFVGRPSWRKNIEFLLGAFKELTRRREDVMLYLHVDFKDQRIPEKPDINKIIHGLGLKDKILSTEQNRWTTGVGADFLNRLYNLCDLYITPHGGEGFGLPIAEAMATGTPFVATDCTSMPEFAGEKEERGLLVKVEKNVREKGVLRPWVEVKDFVNKIDTLLDDKERMKKMGANGITWVEKNCSDKIIIPKWKEIFKKLDIPICNVDSKTTEVEWSEKYAASPGEEA